MMDFMTEVMMKIIRSEVFGAEFDLSLTDSITEEEWKNLYELSKSHDIAHLIGDFAIKRGLLPEGKIKTQFEEDTFLAVYRLQQLQFDLERVKKAFNESQIPFIPLKGSVIRALYPEAWMRTSCDIDILVKKEDFKRALTVCKEKLGCKDEQHTGHDVAFYTDLEMHLEIHHSLVESDRIGTAEKLLESFWDYAKPVNGYEYAVADEMFYYYHLAHMAKHFTGGGGCGIRSFIDLFILNRVGCDKEKRKELLEKGGLTRFATVAEELSEHWFLDADISDLAKRIESFVLSGGIYGNHDNRVSVQQAKTQSKFLYLFGCIWLPLDKMKQRYPVLERKPGLLPFYEMRRWLGFLKPKKFGKKAKMLVADMSTDKDEMAENAQMMKDLGLL